MMFDRPRVQAFRRARAGWPQSRRGNFRLGTCVALGALLVAACDQPVPPATQMETLAFAAGPRMDLAAGHQPTIASISGVNRRIASLLNINQPMRYGEFVWNDAGVRRGESWILVDLKGQTMSVFRGEHEIGTAVTLYGVDDKPTPTGRFRILERRKDHVSSIYDAEMPFTLRLTNDGVAIHGSDVRVGIGTHGCLGIPLDFAARLFAQVKVGTEVIVLRDADDELRSSVRVTAANVS